MKKNVLFLFLLIIFTTINYAAPKEINFNILKDFFDSLSIDEIEKQKKLDAQEEKEEEEETEEADDEIVYEPEETDITRYFKTWVFTGSMGPLWENAGETQTLYLAQNVKKTYSAANNTNTLVGLSLFWGVQKPLFNDILGQIGVTLSNASNAVLNGEIWDDANPKFNNLTYQYSIKATRIAAKGTLLFDKNLIVIPWVSGSAGMSYNYYSNFLNVPKIFEAVRNPNFQSYTSQRFTYSFSAGFQKKLIDHWQLGVGYEFTDWGGGRLSKSAYQTNFNALQMHHYYTNGLIFNITYLA